MLNKATGKKLIVLAILVFVLFPVFVNAAPDWWPLVPCGLNSQPEDKPIIGPNGEDWDYTSPCTRCDLFKLFHNIIMFVLVGLMPPVAAILFVWGGFLILMGGANPGMISQGKEIFWNTFMGIVIISSSWLITNTIIINLADESITNPNTPWYQFECRETVRSPAPSPTTPGTLTITTDSLSNVVIDTNYSSTLTASGGTSPYNWTVSSGALPTGLSLSSTGIISGTATQTGLFSFSVRATDSSSPPVSATKNYSLSVHVQGALAITTGSLVDGRVGQPYSQQVSATGGVAPFTWSVQGSLPTGLSINPSSGLISGTPTTAGNYEFTARVEDSSSPFKLTSTRPLSIRVTEASAPPDNNGEKAVCMFSLADTCDMEPMTCSNASCGQYTTAINQYAGGVADTSLIKAIMIKESSCQVNSTSPDNSSFGLMQLKPSTANMYKQYCGVTENITSGWLLNPNNAETSICIAAEFIRRGLGQSACGGSVRTLAAGYNGGPGACGPSRDCANDVSCAGRQVQRWECPYDNPEQTVCNGGDDIWSGYNQTRDYVRKVSYCYNNPGF